MERHDLRGIGRSIQAEKIAWTVDGRLAMGSTDGWVVMWDLDAHGNARSGVPHD